MNYSDKFRQAVKHLVNNYALEHLHPAMVAQWVLESDRGESALARRALNFAGMKWREELTPFATPLLIQVPSEPVPVSFAQFTSPQDFVRGFFGFLDRPPYAGWRHNPTPEAYIEHIGGTWATDPAYIAKVKALMPEARELITELRGASETAPPVPGDIQPSWFELYKVGNDISLVALSGSQALWQITVKRLSEIKQICDLYGDHNVEVAPAAKVPPPVPTLHLDDLKESPTEKGKPPEPSGELKGLRVFLEAGHGWSGSSFDPGAVGHVQEWTQNKVQATACAKWLRARGAKVRLELYKKGTPSRSLRERGRIAGASDVFVSFHHNAFNGKAQGTETLYDRLADSNDIKLAKTIQSAMMRVSPFANRVVKQQGLGVLRGAKPGSFAACLTEAYFVDGPGIQNAVELDEKLGVAVAQGIAEFAKAAGRGG